MNPEIMFQLADKVKRLREIRDDLKEKTDQANAELSQAERDLVALMVEAETPNFTKSGTRFTVVTKLRASAVAGHKEELFDALKTQGYGSLVTETVNSNSLSAFAKELIEENGDMLPDWLDGLVNTFEQQQIQMRKA